MTLNLGYALAPPFSSPFHRHGRGPGCFNNPFIGFCIGVVVATTTVGRRWRIMRCSAPIGYVGGSILLFTLLMIALGMWRISVGLCFVQKHVSPKVVNILLGDDPLSNRSGPLWRLFRTIRAWGMKVQRRFCGCTGASRGRLFLHEDLSYVLISVGVHPHPPARRGVG